ncbi:hypothetical protein LHV56_19185 [Peribacillus frigoritolerans]|uniref:phage tail assembly chaperone G n=1 Tax=Peribacillus frigoritolerans TaxID=450367 RepID=UPI0020793603|nr:hypothetical protein [Peribacillus frigoritolerans]USK78956.1 hypothetical protein LHV56_19185 [Peribacillus frigoritolerans]
MKIELNEKTYIAPPAKAKMFRRALVITKEYDLENITADTLDELLQFVVEVFGEKFTIEDIYEYHLSGDLIGLVSETIQFVVNPKGQSDGEDDKKK